MTIGSLSVRQSIYPMKNAPTLPLKAKPKLAEIVAKITASKKRADALKKVAQEAKEGFKRVRKTYKQAKKAAKAARRDLKELKKSLAAAKAAVTRSKSAAKTRKQKTARKVIPVIVAADLPVPHAPALSDPN